MSKKLGISELYASLILLIITSSMGVILYNYSSETTLKYQESIVEKKNQSNRLISEKISIIDVNGVLINNQVNITIYNYGDYEVVIDKAYINDVLVTSYNKSINSIIKSQEIKELSIDSPINIENDIKYTILLVSKNGVKVSYSWKK